MLLRERISAGDSDEKVIDFLVARYGDFILLKPRLKPETILLWATAAGAPAGRRRVCLPDLQKREAAGISCGFPQ